MTRYASWTTCALWVSVVLPVWVGCDGDPVDPAMDAGIDAGIETGGDAGTDPDAGNDAGTDGGGAGGTCENETLDPDESDVDCGGACGATCAVGAACTDVADCASDR